MKMSNSDIAKMLVQNDYLSEDDKKVLLRILGQDGNVREKIPLSDRIADAFTDFIGSWSFIIISAMSIAIWVLLNAYVLPNEYVFDEFPFVLLNLALASVAALQSPIIMMSQNKQDKRESLKTQNDYEIDLKTIVITQDLHDKVIDLCAKVDEIIAKVNIKETPCNNVIQLKSESKKELKDISKSKEGH